MAFDYVCPVCNKEFVRKRKARVNIPVCSRPCVRIFYAQGNGGKFFVCPVDGVKFWVVPSRQARKQIGEVCCSHECDTQQHLSLQVLGEITFQPSNGYMVIKSEAGKKRRRVHVVKAEEALGRRLKKGEVVHHIDLDKTNNRNDNLLICTQSYHMWLHNQYQLAWVNEHLAGS